MTREELEQEIETARAAQPALVGIDTTSGASVWRQLRFVWATVAELLLAQLARWQADVAQLVATRPWATVGWYIDRAKAFQAGDMLEARPDGTYGYATVDTAKQVIRQAAIDVVDRELRLKVATEHEGELAKVPDEVMPMFRAYIEQIKRPGTIVRYINAEADLLRLSLRVWFDGELREADVREAVAEAVRYYLRGIVFNGLFSATRLVDTVQQVEGVSEVQWLWATARSANQLPEEAVAVEARYRAASGYLVVETINDVEQLQIELIREP